MHLDHDRPQRGDKISVPFSMLLRHYGVYLGQGQVIHNSRARGTVAIDDLATFSGGAALRVDARARPGEAEAVVQRAMARLGTDYDFIRFNCEHFANEAAHGVPVSYQVLTGAVAVLGVAALGGIAWATSNRWDDAVGRYRRSDGTFAGGRWG